MTDYYARDGRRITQKEWERRPEDNRVDLAEVGDVTVSTVYLGLDHRWGDGPPLIFETMIFGGPYDQDCWRYSDERAARAGHELVSQAVENGWATRDLHVPESV